jgi:hypothetical protein
VSESGSRITVNLSLTLSSLGLPLLAVAEVSGEIRDEVVPANIVQNLGPECAGLFEIHCEDIRYQDCTT